MTREVENVIEITHEELKKVIKISYRIKQSTMIIGRTGIGKSYVTRESCKEIAEENNLIFTEDESYINNPKYFVLIDRRLSMMEASDIQGIPFVFAVIQDSSKEDTPLSTIPIQNLNGIRNEKYKILGYKTLWVKPSFLPLKGYGLIFLDEITLAPPLLQSAAYSLIYDRRVGDYILPDNYLVIGASNVEEDQAYTHSMAGPLRNRFIWYKLKIPNIEEYTNWATQHKPEEYLPLDSRILAYLNARGIQKHLFNFDRNCKDKAFPTPRAWHYVSKLIKDVHNNRMLRILVSSAIGCGEAHEFLAFLNLEHKLKPIEEYFKNPTKIELPEDMGLKYFLIGSIVEYYGKKSREYKQDKRKTDLLDRYIKLINRLEPEFSVLAIKMTRGLDPNLRDKLYNLKGVDNLIERLSKYFT